MNFFDILTQTSYNEQTKNDVASFIMDYFSDSKLHNIYLVTKNFNKNKQENIFLIQKTIQLPTELKQIKIVRILIYISTNFPNTAPKFYVERAENHSVFEVQREVNKSSYEITVKSLSEWKGIGDFINVLNDVIGSFNRIYPLYKLEIHKRKGIVYPEDSFVPQNALKISLNGAEQINNAVSNYNNNNNNYNNLGNNSKLNMNGVPIANTNMINNNNYNYPNFNNFNKPAADSNFNNLIANYNIINNNPGFYKQHEEKTSFTDDDIKKLLAEHTILTIKEKFLQNYYTNKKSRIALEELKINLNTKTNEISDKITEGKKILNAFEKLQKELNKEMANLKDKIIASSRVRLSFDNFKDFVEIPDKEEHLMKLISIESTLEDFIFSLKKSFEKNVLSFDESMRYIRKISKEIFVINFLKKKLMQAGMN